MAVPHYSYLVLKMPTKKGVLTLRGNVYTAYTCEEESFRVIGHWSLGPNGRDYNSGRADLTRLARDIWIIGSKENIKSKEHNEIQLVDNDPKKTALIGATLDPK